MRAILQTRWLMIGATVTCAGTLACVALIIACLARRGTQPEDADVGAHSELIAPAIAAEELERQMVELHREYEHAMLHPHVNKRFSEEFSEGDLRRVLAKTQDEHLALSVAHALAEFGTEPESFRAVLGFVAEPRTERRVDRADNDFYYFAKIRLIYLAARFECEDCLETLRDWMRSERSRELVDSWQRGLSDVQSSEPAHWQAALQGRAAYGLVLSGREGDRRLVEDAYHAAVESVRQMVAAGKPSSRLANPQVTYAVKLLDNFCVAMAIAHCVDIESSDACLDYLHSPTGAQDPIGAHLSATSRQLYADIGWPEGF